MASLSELKSEEELEQWGILDAIRQTEVRQQLTKGAGRFEFITKNNKREVIPSTCSLNEFALTKHVMQLVSRPNTATYLLESVNYMSASKDFRKFIGFIDTYPEPGKSELATLVFPIFVYFYLLLLQSGPSGHFDAKSFFQKNRDVFAHADSYDAVLQTLSTFKNWTDVKEDTYYKNFLECRYIIGLSPDVLWDLRDFVESQAKEEGDQALLYVLHFHIHFQDNDEAEYIESIGEELVTPTLERNEYESVEPEDAKSVSEPMTTSELFSSLSKAIENEEVRIDGISSSDFVTTRSLESPSKSSDSIRQDDGKSDIELETLLKDLSLNHPQISTIVTNCPRVDISCVDFNEDETEIAYAIGSNCIYIAPLDPHQEQTKRPAPENFDDEITKRQRFEEERMEIVPSSPSPQRKALSLKGVKCLKMPRNGKTIKLHKGSKRTKETKSGEDEPNKDDERTSLIRNMKEIKVPGEDVYVVKYLPGKPHLLLVCNTKVKLLNTKSGSFEAEYEGNSFIFDIDINSTSQYFATANMDSVSHLYSFDMNTEIQNFVGHLSAVTCVRFHPNGLYIATGSDDSTVRLFDIESGLCVRKFSDYMAGIVEMAFSPDGKLLSSGDCFGTVKVWDIKEGLETSDICFSTEIETLGKITTLCFHSDSSLLMACNLKGECKLWDVRNQENLQVINFINTPLKAKFSKSGIWRMAFQENPT